VLRNARHRCVSLALGALLTLLWCGSALGVPTGVVLTSPGNDSTPTFAWAANPLVSFFDWELTGPGVIRTGQTAAAGVEVAPALADGAYSFRVREFDPLVGLSEFSGSVGVTIDTVAPTISVTSPVANSVIEAGTVVIARYTCPGAIVCTGSVANGLAIGTARVGARTFAVQASDAAGNAVAASVPWRVVDTRAPTPSALLSPGEGSVVGVARPPFSWTAAVDAQGVHDYEVFLNGVRQVSLRANRPRTWTPSRDLASGTYTWFVRAIDDSGHAADSILATFRIDTLAPPAPTFTQVPGNPGASTAPVVAWNGTGPTYTWSLFRTGVAAPIAGPTTGTQSSATLGPLTEGSYTFRLNQTNAFARRSADAEIGFRVDLTPPAAPTVTARPPATSAGPAPVFAWNPAEPGGTFAWQVLSPGGSVVQSAQSVSPQITTSPLSSGDYRFVVRQIDEAGNSGAASGAEAFSIVAATSTGTKSQRSLARRRPSTLTPRHLRPAPGARLKGRRSVLRWSPGPKGTTVYNLQFFRITPAGKIVKMLSVFPRRTQFVLRSGRLKRGQRYIWRVWPYLHGTTIAPRPVGVSFFNLLPRAKPKAKPKAA
jgi:hypothetical protein